MIDTMQIVVFTLGETDFGFPIDSLPKYINNQNILYIVKNYNKLIYILNFKNILSRSLSDVL